jgi:hypothetical protein
VVRAETSQTPSLRRSSPSTGHVPGQSVHPRHASFVARMAPHEWALADGWRGRFLNLPCTARKCISELPISPIDFANLLQHLCINRNHILDPKEDKLLESSRVCLPSPYIPTAITPVTCRSNSAATRSQSRRAEQPARPGNVTQPLTLI